MGKIKFWFLLSGTFLLLLAVGIFIGWTLHRPSKALRDLAEELEQMGAQPATDRDWRGLEIEKETVLVSGIEMPVVTVKNLRPLLEVESNTSAHHISVSNTRKEGKVKSIIWSHKGKQTLEFDWLGAKLNKVKKDARPTDFYLCPESIPSAERISRKKYLVSTSKIDGQPVLDISTTQKDITLPWKRSSVLREVYYYKNYPICVVREQLPETGKAIGMVIVDLERHEVAATIPLPSYQGHVPPLFLIDPTTDVLMCFDMGLSWVVYVDLIKGIDQTKKPWPPPWPDPRLGPWRGMDDVSRGRSRQAVPKHLRPVKTDEN